MVGREEWVYITVPALVFPNVVRLLSMLIQVLLTRETYCQFLKKIITRNSEVVSQNRRDTAVL